VEGFNNENLFFLLSMILKHYFKPNLDRKKIIILFGYFFFTKKKVVLGSKKRYFIHSKDK
jgi:hypothetical protein